ncbi:MAG: hypothetical protein KZQ99_10020 [Candidatus Thiodiazotropha sp. (ex Dulcina madagascariensis)]|nr:hypothetical protein [Candidatus Thiodiazotropha sp. (ex Epidulcina cf. delphinae)]MCU7921753.1 hypothetical protein [Candidatus Thiodiazotropha sp. (ex Dulcina madagascariensis)]MCU7925935.1 hypothetical protein [Candidatus Thiodiazotropha sp. (ex Dulcina madagascariensis)]MCU7935201.1 hypothetical protein [Candidatus Thiodiazotropha sp. (ex Dulcina madagascariensis)]
MTTKEKFPEIFNENLPGGATNEVNITNKRLYLAIRHLLSELFSIDRANDDPGNPPLTPDPSQFKDYYKVDDPNDPSKKIPDYFNEDKIRFLAIIGQLRLAGYEDPSFARIERWSKYLKDVEDADIDMDEESEFARLFPRGSMRTAPQPENDVSSANIVWVPESSRPVKVETFGTEPDPRGPDRSTNPPTQRFYHFRVLIVAEFITRFTEAMQQYSAYSELYKQVYRGLHEHSQGKFNGTQVTVTISAKQLADVTERLIRDNVNPNDPNIRLTIQSVIARTISSASGSGGLDGNFSAFGISLPDLDAGTHVEIIPDNLHAVRVIYYCAQLEEMRLFATVDTVVEHATSGMLPISRGPGLDRIYRWIKRAPERINEFERRGLYARVLGLAQGSVDEPLPNREFSDLWFRFLASVSLKFREITSSERSQVSDEQIHKAGRDLAVNISLHGYGITAPAAIEMQGVVQEMIDMLSDTEILRSYGVRDIWQLVDRVSALYLNGAANGVKFRTMAASGERIISWLARKAPILSSASALGLGITTFDGRGNRRPTNDFFTLAELAERWLAVTGTTDEMAERHTDPVDLDAQLTVPMLGQNTGFQAGIQNTLDQAGIELPAMPAVPQI